MWRFWDWNCAASRSISGPCSLTPSTLSLGRQAVKAISASESTSSSGAASSAMTELAAPELLVDSDALMAFTACLPKLRVLGVKLQGPLMERDAAQFQSQNRHIRRLTS